MEEDWGDQEACEWSRYIETEERDEDPVKDGVTQSQSDRAGGKPAEDQLDEKVERDWETEDIGSYLPEQEGGSKAAEGRSSLEQTAQEYFL